MAACEKCRGSRCRSVCSGLLVFELLWDNQDVGITASGCLGLELGAPQSCAPFECFFGTPLPPVPHNCVDRMSMTAYLTFPVRQTTECSVCYLTAKVGFGLAPRIAKIVTLQALAQRGASAPGQMQLM